MSDARGWADFMQLKFVLPELAGGDNSHPLPVDVSPLADLCRQHTDIMLEGEQWTYEFFYLELLSQECTLQPLFWADPLVGFQLREGEAVRRYLSRQSLADEGRGPQSQCLWASRARGWVRTGVIEPGDGGPWLRHVEFSEPDDPVQRELLTSTPGLAPRLQYRKLPYYYLPEAYETTITAMKLELWRTSLFHPMPMSNQGGESFRVACNRFAIAYRRRTHQQLRRLAFVRYVCECYEAEMSNPDIARKAVGRGLWPFGTRKRREPGTTGTKSDDVENCARAVLRVLPECEGATRQK